MDRLPVEVLLNVFSFVPQEELVTTIPQVCRLWRDVAADPSLFRTLVLVNEAPNTAIAIRLLSTATWLTSVTLSGRTDTDDLLQHIGVNHPRLMELDIVECRGSPTKKKVSAIPLRHLVRRCTTLQYFSLQTTPCNSQVLLTEIMVHLPYLRGIEIFKSLKYDPNALVNITNYCNSIEQIYVSWPGVQTISSNEFANFCEKFKESLTVFLINIAWTNASLASMSTCRAVKHLALYDCEDITDEGIMSLCQLTKLKTLLVAPSLITSPGWVRLFEDPSMKSLAVLDVDTTENLDDLALSAISRLPNLTDVSLPGSAITDEGLLALSNIPNLADLTIECSTNITSPGWIRFFQTSNVQQKMTHLRLLHCTNVNDEVKQAITQNLPNLQTRELS